jgi:(2Fe-2S) ferredoxin
VTSEARYEILVCRGPTCGGRRNSEAIVDAVRALVSSHRLEARVTLGHQNCFGRCTRGPNALVRELVVGGEPVFGLTSLARLRAGGRAAFYAGLEPADARALIVEHVLGGAIVERLLDDAPDAGAASPASGGDAPACSRRLSGGGGD